MVRPMLAKIGDEYFLSKKDFIFEPKIDGIRALCFADNNLKFLSRNGNDVTTRYPELKIMNNIKARSCILDGEIAVFHKGKPDFQLTMRKKEMLNPVPAIFIVFDILMKDGEDLTNLPLIKRKEILDLTVENGKFIEKIYYTKNGKKLWQEMLKREMEGVIAKKENSFYYPDQRTPDWVKVKSSQTVDCIILGYTSYRRVVSSLALGLYKKGELRFMGHVGTGFSHKEVINLHKKFTKIHVPKAYLEYPDKKPVHWIKPKYTCEVVFSNLTRDGILRAPVYKGLRIDKDPKDCTWENQLG